MRLLHRSKDSNAHQTPERWSTRLQAAAALIADRGDGRSAPVIDGHPATAFLGGSDAVLGYLYSRWVTYFGVAIEEQLDAGCQAVVDAAWRAWAEVLHDHIELARILTWYRDEPAVRAAEERHRQMLAQFTATDSRDLPDFQSAGMSAAIRSLEASR